ncbi:MAG: hypothetical protein ACMZI0_18320 [Symbiopectobacterium sp.]|uniref:hypothetical protein n=1 Tax=Symbiopectobacterium sp. TaxID=2952789 RepID=UPI0039E9DDDE
MSQSNDKKNIAFDSLHINALGELTAKVMGENIYYTITFNKNTEINTVEGTAKKINVTYRKQSEPLSTALSLQTEDGNTIHYHLKNNELYLRAYSIGNKIYDYSLMGYKLNTSISKKYLITSVKGCRNTLQIEALKGYKIRIFYLDPNDIAMSQLRAKRISHKPPQSLYSFLGGDIHEKYYSGQPFSSSRLGNFGTSLTPFFLKSSIQYAHPLIKTKQKKVKSKSSSEE